MKFCQRCYERLEIKRYMDSKGKIICKLCYLGNKLRYAQVEYTRESNRLKKIQENEKRIKRIIEVRNESTSRNF